MKALILDAEALTANVEEIPQPVPKHNELLIKVHAISLNPIDPLYVARPLASSGRTIGSDFAGILVSLGSSVPSSSCLKPGERVAGFLQGACSVNDRPGAFAEFVVCEWDLVWKVPKNVALEEAAGVSLVALTAAQGIWFRLGLPAPFSWTPSKRNEEHPEWHAIEKIQELKDEELKFFVYGASTSVGLYAAQMARLAADMSGKKLKLFGTASKYRWDMLSVEPYSYNQLVDYRDKDWQPQIRELVGPDGVDYAYDGISEGESVAGISHLLARNGKVAIVRSRAAGAWTTTDVRQDIEPVYGAVWEGLGAEIQYHGFTVRESPAAREFAVAFYGWLSKAAGSALKLNPIRSMPGSFKKVVEDGFELLGPGKVGDRITSRGEEWMKPVSAEKLVYDVQ